MKLMPPKSVKTGSKRGRYTIVILPNVCFNSRIFEVTFSRCFLTSEHLTRIFSFRTLFHETQHWNLICQAAIKNRSHYCLMQTLLHMIRAHHTFPWPQKLYSTGVSNELVQILTLSHPQILSSQ